MANTYKAFISYSRADQKWAEWLHKKLETYVVPYSLRRNAPDRFPRRLSPVFRDLDEMAAGPSLRGSLTEALDRSEWLIVLCSPSSAASRWVGEEIKHFVSSGRHEKIALLIVGRTLGAGPNDKEWLHPAVIHHTDGVVLPEPLAADATTFGEGMNAAFLKIVAAMLGIGYGDLTQRDLKRRRHRLLLGATALVAGGGIAAATFSELHRKSQLVESQRQRVSKANSSADLLLNQLSKSSSRARGTRELIVLDDDLGAIEQFLASLPDDEKSQDIWRRLGDIAFERGTVQHYLGRNEEAADSVRRSLDVLDKHCASKDVDLIRSERSAWLSNILVYNNKLGEAKLIADTMMKNGIPALKKRLGNSDASWCILMLRHADVLSKESMARKDYAGSLATITNVLEEANAWWDQNKQQPGEMKNEVAGEILANVTRQLMLSVFLRDEESFLRAAAEGERWYEWGRAKYGGVHGHYCLYGGQVFGFRGDWFFLRKDFARAAENYQKSIQIFDQLFGDDSGTHRLFVQHAVWRAFAYFRLAAVQSKLGSGVDDPEVRKHLDNGLRILRDFAKQGSLDKGLVDLALNSINDVVDQGVANGSVSKREKLAFMAIDMQVRGISRSSETKQSE